MNHNTTATGVTSDRDMLNDLLMTEKYISGTYDTAIMECANQTIRDALSHIQKEEQQHAKMLFDAMNQRGWYTPQ